VKKKCYLYNFPSLKNASIIREPSVLYLALDKEKWDCEFVFDNSLKGDGDIYLCSVFTSGYPNFVDFSKKIGKDRIIVGGHHPSLCPKDFLGIASTIVMGHGGNIEEIINGRGNGIVRGEFKSRHMNRNLFPLNKARDLIHADIYPSQSIISTASTTGCPFNCDFCCTPILNNYKFSFLSLEYLKEEIRMMEDYPAELLYIRDENIFIHPRLKEVIKLLGKTGRRIYSFGTAALITEDIIKRLKDNNWHELGLGIDDIEVKYPKNKKFDQVIEWLHKHQINVHLYLIINNAKPKKEAERYFGKILKTLFKYLPHSLSTTFLTPYPGTKIFGKYKNKLNTNDYSKFDDSYPIICPPSLINWYKTKRFTLLVDYYRSKQYAKMRNFECGDSLHLFISESEKRSKIKK